MLFLEVTEATAVLAVSVSTTAAAVVSARHRQPVFGLATAPKAVLTLDRNAKDCLVVVVSKVATAAEVAVAAVVASAAVEGSTEVASVILLVDVGVAAASAATAVVVPAAAVAVADAGAAVVAVDSRRN